jgi:hypothetical protein
MKLEPMTDDVPALTQRLPEPAIEVAFASYLTQLSREADAERTAILKRMLQQPEK